MFQAIQSTKPESNVEKKEFDPNEPVDNLKRVFYLSKKKETVLKGYFLRGVSPENEIQQDEIKVLHSVKGFERKVESGKRIVPIYDKETKKYVKSIYNKFDECLLTAEMERAKLADKNSMVNARSVEVYIPFFLKEMSFKHEEKEYTQTVNKPILLSLNVGDMYFATASNGMARKLEKKKAKLKDHEVSLTYDDIEIGDKLSSDDKKVVSEVERLRNNQNELKKIFEHLKPYTYAEWYEMSHGEKLDSTETEEIPF